MKRNGMLALLLLVSTVALAGDRKALVGGRLIDGLLGEPLANSVILIDGDTIQAVGSIDTLPVPDGYEVISTEGMSVLPGLWDMHVHLMINGHADYPHWHATYPDRFASEIMPASAEQLLLAGVTTARDLGAPLDASLSVRQRIADGDIPGPRLFISGPFIQHEAVPGHSPNDIAGASNGERDARDKVRRACRSRCRRYQNGRSGRDEPSRKRQAVVDEAHKHGLPVVAHSHRPDEIRRGLEIGVDNFEHTGPRRSARLSGRHRRTRCGNVRRPGRVRGGPLYWTPTVEGPMELRRRRRQPGTPRQRLLAARPGADDTIADIEGSPLRKP